MFELDNSKLGSTQQQKICCQDHILTEDIWFVCSETSNVEMRRDVTDAGRTNDNQPITEDIATQPMEAGG